MAEAFKLLALHFEFQLPPAMKIRSTYPLTVEPLDSDDRRNDVLYFYDSNDRDLVTIDFDPSGRVIGIIVRDFSNAKIDRWFYLDAVEQKVKHWFERTEGEDGVTTIERDAMGNIINQVFIR